METWEEIFKSVIPVGIYQVSVKNGEETGLLIGLESKEYFVNINFGAVSALRMLDEGIILDNLFDTNEVLRYKENGFSNVIYKINDGDFSKSIKNYCKELYDYLDLKHYLIVTMNYVIEVVADFEPEIDVKSKA